MVDDITLGDQTYRVGKLDAMRQFHVMRRIGPVLSTMGVSVSEAVAQGKDLSGDAAMLGMMGNAMDVVSQMPDADVEYVIHTCLSVAKRQQGDRWAPVMTGKAFQFQDIGMDTMMRLTVETLRENMGSFFPMALGAPQ